MHSDRLLELGRSQLGTSGPAEAPKGRELPQFRFVPARLNDNEAILLDESARESWIIYPPRSLYTHVRRPTSTDTVVEYHPWAPLTDTVDHVVRAADGCLDHGIECDAFAVIKAAAELGWNAFT